MDNNSTRTVVSQFTTRISIRPAEGFRVPPTPTVEVPPSTNNTLMSTPQNPRIQSLMMSSTPVRKGSGGCESPRFLQIPPSPAMQRLGYGTGVGVFLMERSPKPSGEPRSPWAIKKVASLKGKGMDKPVYKTRLDREADILKTLSHPNIIGYRAYVHLSPDTTCLAMESASRSLNDLIEERLEGWENNGNGSLNNPAFPAKTIVKVAMDIAEALRYLHEEKKYIHGDLKSANVLVFGDFEVVKLCDFGVSRKIREDGKIEGRYVGTEIWNPMEVLLVNRGQRKYPVTAKADIYPFGLTLFEILSLKPPHLGTIEESCGDTLNSNSEQEASFNEEDFEAALQKQIGKRPVLPPYAFDSSYNLILQVIHCCTDEDPARRPHAKAILLVLNDSQNANGADQDNDNGVKKTE